MLSPVKRLIPLAQMSWQCKQPVSTSAEVRGAQVLGGRGGPSSAPGSIFILQGLAARQWQIPERLPVHWASLLAQIPQEGPFPMFLPGHPPCTEPGRDAAGLQPMGLQGSSVIPLAPGPASSRVSTGLSQRSPGPGTLHPLLPQARQATCLPVHLARGHSSSPVFKVITHIPSTGFNSTHSCSTCSEAGLTLDPGSMWGRYKCHLDSCYAVREGSGGQERR